MDGIKKPLSTSRTVATTEPQKEQRLSFQKREELYIPKEETAWEQDSKKTFPENHRLRKIALGFLFFIFFVLISLGIFFLCKAYSVSKKISVSSPQKTTLAQNVKTFIAPIIPSSNDITLQGAQSGRINILLLGAAGENKPGGNLTDTIMIMSVDTKNKKVSMLSLPRDFYVPIPQTNSFTKINSLYKIGIAQQLGADLIKQSVEKITNTKINYYLVVNFDAFEKIIDNIGGVNIISERDIYDPRYPGPNYSYETFSLAKGAHLLDGKTTLKYVRQRHDDPEGDFGRAKRQQQVIQAFKNKLFSVQTLFNVTKMSNILDTLGDNIKTDMSFSDIEQFIRLSKSVDTQNISNVVVDAWKPESLLKVSHVLMGNVQAFILVPRVGNYSEIQELSQNIFNQSEIKKRHEEIIKENASIGIINASSDNQLAIKIKKLLSEKLEMKNVRIIPNTNNESSQQTTISILSNIQTEKLFTTDELIKKLPATLVSQKADSTDEIMVTLGNDIVAAFNYAEATMEDLNNSSDNQENFDFTSKN